MSEEEEKMIELLTEIRDILIELKDNQNKMEYV